jgi:hypothetical protein
MNKRILLLPVSIIAFTPLIASAVVVADIVQTLLDILQLVIPFLSAVAIAFFVYGVIKYITAAGDVEKQKSAKGYILYGIIGLFVLVAFWALVTVLTSTFGLTERQSPIHPDARGLL